MAGISTRESSHGEAEMILCSSIQKKATPIRILKLAALAAVLMWSNPIWGQTRLQTPTPSSDLARENFGLVAASAAEIKVVLVKDPGLMVDLKLWVARDATDQGQMVSESDLTNDAIYDRLESDVRFRSVATQLLQKYGYLVPQVNPDSDAGKQQELLIQERAKWIAQHEEEEMAESRQKDLQATQQTTACKGDDTETAQLSLQGCVPGQQRGGPANSPVESPAGGDSDQSFSPLIPRNGSSGRQPPLMQASDQGMGSY